MMTDADLGKFIFHASSGGDEAGLAELLADPRAEAVLSWSDSGQGWTSLHVAAEMRHADVIRALLRAGAPLEARDRQGWTPLFVAVDADIDASLQENEPLDLTCTKLLLSAVPRRTPLHQTVARPSRSRSVMVARRPFELSRSAVHKAFEADEGS